MKRKLLRILKITTLATFGLFGTVFGQTSLSSGFFNNDFSGSSLNNTDQTVILKSGVSATQANGKITLTLDNVGSYEAMFVDSLASPVDISANPTLVVKLQTSGLALSETDASPAVSLIWYVIDANGNTAKKDAWQRDMWIGAGNSDMKEYVVDMSTETDGCDLTRIVAVVLHNQSHNGDWSKNKLNGTIIIDDLKIGKAPLLPTLTSGYFHNDFASIDNPNQKLIYSPEVVANEADGAVEFMISNLESYTTILKDSFSAPIDITANPVMTVKMQTTDLALTETDGNPAVSLIWYVTDVNGKTAKQDAWQRDLWIGAGSTEMKSYAVDMTQETDGCDLTKIVAVSLRNQSHNSDWSKNKISGKIIIDDIAIGKLVLQPSLSWSYFHNDCKAIETPDYTFQLPTAVTSNQANDTIAFAIDKLESYLDILTNKFTSPIDISANPTMVVKMQTRDLTLSNVDAAPAVSLIWYVTDANGNTAKQDAWQRDMWIGTGSTEMKTYTIDMSLETNGIDLTKIASVSLHNQSHNSDWSKNLLSGTIVIDDIQLGKVIVAASKVTATSYENQFTQPGGISDESQTTTSGANVALKQEAGVLTSTLTSVAANANILKVTLANTIDLDLSVSTEMKVYVNPVLTSGKTIIIYLEDQNGKKTISKEVDLNLAGMVRFNIEAGEANIQSIKAIVIDNGSEVGVGTLAIDSMFVGSATAKVVRNPRMQTINAKLGKNALVDGIAEADIWADVPKVNLDRFVNWTADYAADPSPENLSGYFQSYFTADSVYFFVNISDNSNSYFTSGNTWEYDAVELYFNPDLSNDQATGAYGDDAIQIPINRRADSFNGKDQKGAVKYSYAIHELGDAIGYAAEFAVSLADMKINISDNFTFGVEVDAIDGDQGVNDGKRTRKVIWNMDMHNDVAYNDTRSFGTFALAPIPLVSVSQSTFTIESKILTITLSPAIPGLTVSNFEIAKNGANLTLKSATTNDNGSTYIIESRNTFAEGVDYELTTTMAGYTINKLTFQYSTVGVSEKEKSIGRIYPNPVSDKLFVEGNDLKSIEIISVSGCLVKTMNTSGMKAVVDVTSLNSGIYFIKTINQQGKIQTKKFIKK
jgi:hypothetical protein